MPVTRPVLKKGTGVSGCWFCWRVINFYFCGIIALSSSPCPIFSPWFSLWWLLCVCVCVCVWKGVVPLAWAQRRTCILWGGLCSSGDSGMSWGRVDAQWWSQWRLWFPPRPMPPLTPRRSWGGVFVNVQKGRPNRTVYACGGLCLEVWLCIRCPLCLTRRRTFQLQGVWCSGGEDSMLNQRQHYGRCIPHVTIVDWCKIIHTLLIINLFVVFYFWCFIMRSDFRLNVRRLGRSASCALHTHLV